jgi:Domain of unknown function (DUF397)
VNGGGASHLAWRRGRPCDSGACVEVADTGDAVLVRNSTDPDGARLRLSRDEWASFLESAKDGLFDGV